MSEQKVDDCLFKQLESFAISLSPGCDSARDTGY